MALTAGATTDRRPNAATSTGVSSMAIASLRPREREDAARAIRRRVEITDRSAAVATKESQKPPEVSASGSEATSTSAASASMS